MSEKVERGARALYVGRLWRLGVVGPHVLRHPEWEEMDTAAREPWRQLMRAAIEAMREPTDAMIDAGTPHLSIAEHAWRAMIDEALK